MEASQILSGLKRSYFRIGMGLAWCLMLLQLIWPPQWSINTEMLAALALAQLFCTWATALLVAERPLLRTSYPLPPAAIALGGVPWLGWLLVLVLLPQAATAKECMLALLCQGAVYLAFQLPRPVARWLVSGLCLSAGLAVWLAQVPSGATVWFAAAGILVWLVLRFRVVSNMAWQQVVPKGWGGLLLIPLLAFINLGLSVQVNQVLVLTALTLVAGLESISLFLHWRAYANLQEEQLYVNGRQLANQVEANELLRLKNRMLQHRHSSALQQLQQRVDFTVSMSHELLTPVTAVNGMVGLLQGSSLSAEQQQCLNTLQRSCTVLQELTDDLLDFSRLESGMVELSTLPFDLRTTFDETLELLRPLAAEKQLELIFHYPLEQPGLVCGDARRVRQVLLNLISYGIQVTEEGYVLLAMNSIESDQPGCYEGSCWFEFHVRYSGEPLAPDQERLLRMGQPPNLDGSSAMALMVVWRFVELMEGALAFSVISKERGEYGFTVRLPLLIEEETALQDAAADQHLEPWRVLVVDGLALNHQVLGEQLTGLGMRVGRANTGEQALAELSRGIEISSPWQLVIIDSTLSDQSGFELGQRISTHEGFQMARPHMVMTTLTPAPGDAERAQSSGFAGYLLKPLQPVLLQPLLLALQAGPVRQLLTSHALMEQVGQQAIAQPLPSSGWRVLVVDDNLLNLQVASTMLEKLGCLTDKAASGAEAIRLAERVPYDLILMDSQMPSIDGFEATRQIRAGCLANQDTPIIAMVNHLQVEDKQLCFVAGMDEVLAKPIKLAALKQAMERWYGEHHRYQSIDAESA